MKHGMIFFAALLSLALVFSPAAYSADTVNVNSTVDDNNFGPGADIAVNSSGVPYVSFITGGSVKVAKGPGFLSADEVNVATYSSNDAKLTAIAFVGPNDSPVVAVVQAGNAGDSFVDIYMSVGGGAYTLQVRDTVSHFDSGITPVVPGDSVHVNAIDLAATDSFVILAISYAVDSHGIAAKTQATILLDTPTVVAHMFRLEGTGFGITSAARLATDRLTMFSGAYAADIQLELSLAEASSIASDSDQAFYVLVSSNSDSFELGHSAIENLPADSGVVLIKAYADTRGLRNRSGVRVIGGGRRVNDAAMAVEKVGGSDTRDLITVMVAFALAGGTVDTYLIAELGGDSDIKHGLVQDTSAPVLSDTYGDIDTGIRALQPVIGPATTLAFGRNGSSLGMIYIAGGNLYSATTSFTRSNRLPGGGSAATVSWTVDTVGTGTGHDANNFTQNVVAGAVPSDSTANAAQELSQVMLNGALYISGYNDVTDHVFYTTLLGGSESKKKDSAVCLFDRLFGQTSVAKAVFPGMKTFRDTLLGTDLGRKIVSLYYSF